jgi:hypothetical protein
LPEITNAIQQQNASVAGGTAPPLAPFNGVAEGLDMAGKPARRIKSQPYSST